MPAAFHALNQGRGQVSKCYGIPHQIIVYIAAGRPEYLIKLVYFIQFTIHIDGGNGYFCLYNRVMVLSCNKSDRELGIAFLTGPVK